MYVVYTIEVFPCESSLLTSRATTVWSSSNKRIDNRKNHHHHRLFNVLTEFSKINEWNFNCKYISSFKISTLSLSRYFIDLLLHYCIRTAFLLVRKSAHQKEFTFSYRRDNMALKMIFTTIATFIERRLWQNGSGVTSQAKGPEFNPLLSQYVITVFFFSPSSLEMRIGE